MRLAFQVGIVRTNLCPVVTDAPETYDGFGTFTVRPYPYPSWRSDEEDPKARLVLIHQEHLAWQTGRYSSGCYAVDATPDDKDPGISEEHLTTELIKRLLR